MSEIHFRADEVFPVYFIEPEAGIGTFTVTLTEQEAADYQRVWAEYEAWQSRLYELDPHNI